MKEVNTLQQNIRQKTNNQVKYLEPKRPWKIMAQNIRGLITENTKIKIDFLTEYVKEEKFILLNFTETWLDNTIDNDADIEGFNLFRGDRENRKNGGTAIYVNEKLDASYLCKMSHEKCEMVAVQIPEIQTINIVVYRPPKTKFQDFDRILTKIKEILNSLPKPDPTVIISGDFNFPFVRWKKIPENSCTWKYISNTNATVDEKQQFEKLMSICDNQCMLQIVEEPTREENTLDLIFSNEISLINSIEINKSRLSDHNCIEVSTNYIIDEKIEIEEVGEDPKCELRQLNFHAKNIDWKNVNTSINSIKWEDIFRNKNALEIGKCFLGIIIKICLLHIPKKQKQKSNSKIPKERKRILNRIKMLKRDKHRAFSKEKKQIIEEKIVESEGKLLESRRREKLESEERAIECMKDNPRMLFSIINKQKKRKNEIGPFKEGNEYICDKKEICNSLKTEFISQFSAKNENVEKKQIFDDGNSNDLCDIVFGKEDIEEGINELDENSAAGPDGLPAILLKKTKNSIANPLTLLLRKSLDEGRIPDVFKLAYITPIHKGGSRHRPEQYRPVSLTSHVMKVFERVVKKHIVKHLIKHQKFNNGQHGFIRGRSTQTQLLAHHNDIYEAITEGKRLDTVFLDFAKAFDKVNHDILLEKVRKHMISGKIGRWIEEFLRDRKFRVVANGFMS